jgi:hypothetical protein
MITTEADSLEKEVAFFEQHREDFVNQANGKFALVKGESLVGIFETQAAAIRAGYRNFGNQPFLVKQIVLADLPLNIAVGEKSRHGACNM